MFGMFGTPMRHVGHIFVQKYFCGQHVTGMISPANINWAPVDIPTSVNGMIAIWVSFPSVTFWNLTDWKFESRHLINRIGQILKNKNWKYLTFWWLINLFVSLWSSKHESCHEFRVDLYKWLRLSYRWQIQPISKFRDFTYNAGTYWLSKARQYSFYLFFLFIKIVTKCKCNMCYSFKHAMVWKIVQICKKTKNAKWHLTLMDFSFLIHSDYDLQKSPMDWCSNF